MEWLNQIIHGDLFDILPSIPDQTINAVITSPPYAMQRRSFYGGVTEADYAAWSVRWMQAIKPKLTHDGNVAIVIRPHVHNGGISDYVLRTRLALRDDKWNEVEELIWIKPTSAPMGHTGRPRRAWESILWFAKSRQPYCEPRPATIAKMSDRIGMHDCKAKTVGLIKGNQRGGIYSGIARVRDYIECGTGDMIRESTPHPAQYPVKLADWLIRMLSPPGGMVADPFSGSGTTLVAARQAGRQFVGMEIQQEYCDIAAQRLGQPCVVTDEQIGDDMAIMTG